MSNRYDGEHPAEPRARGVLENTPDKVEAMRQLQELGAESIPALLRVYADDTLDSRLRDTLAGAVRAMPDWEAHLIKVMKYADLNLSIAAAGIGWNQAAAHLSLDQRKHKEEEQMKRNLQQENLDKLEEYMGKPVVITLWEGMTRKGTLTELTSSHAILEVTMKLLGSLSVIERKVGLKEIKTVDLAE